LQPALFDGVAACVDAMPEGIQPAELPAASFSTLPDISIDYAIMEKAANVAVVPGDFDWNDIGSWKAISELDDADGEGNRVRGNAIVIDSRDCYVQSERRLVAAVGVRDLVIVDTDDAVLVSDREHAQQVKRVVEQLRADKHEAATFHQTVHRPWGSF